MPTTVKHPDPALQSIGSSPTTGEPIWEAGCVHAIVRTPRVQLQLWGACYSDNTVSWVARIDKGSEIGADIELAQTALRQWTDNPETGRDWRETLAARWLQTTGAVSLTDLWRGIEATVEDWRVSVDAAEAQSVGHFTRYVAGDR